MALGSSHFIVMMFLLSSLLASSLTVASAGNLNQNFDITWGNGRGRMLNNGELLTLSLDKASGSGFKSKNEYLFGKIDMQLKRVPGDSAGTVTAYYVSLHLTPFAVSSTYSYQEWPSQDFSSAEPTSVQF